MMIEAIERIGQIEILLIEDNPADVVLMKEALKRGNIPNNLSVTVTGDEALDFLHRRGKYRDAVRQDLIMLDLNLPHIDGRVVVAEIKNDPRLMNIPVVIVATSRSQDDIEEYSGTRVGLAICKKLLNATTAASGLNRSPVKVLHFTLRCRKLERDLVILVPEEYTKLYFTKSRLCRFSCPHKQAPYFFGKLFKRIEQFIFRRIISER